MPPLLYWAAALCAIVYLPLSSRPAGTLRSAVKTLSVALLALVAFQADAPLLLVIALSLCALGDALLSRETDPTFMAGIGAFAAGHLAYAALFLSLPSSQFSLIWQSLFPCLGLLFLGILMAALLAPRAGDLKIPVLAYIPIILTMGLTALTLPATGTLIWILPAVLAFVASDLILASEKFLLPPQHPVLRLTPFLIWPLYWGAQAGFTLALT